MPNYRTILSGAAAAATLITAHGASAQSPVPSLSDDTAACSPSTYGSDNMQLNHIQFVGKAQVNNGTISAFIEIDEPGNPLSTFVKIEGRVTSDIRGYIVPTRVEIMKGGHIEKGKVPILGDHVVGGLTAVIMPHTQGAEVGSIDIRGNNGSHTYLPNQRLDQLEGLQITYNKAVNALNAARVQSLYCEMDAAGLPGPSTPDTSNAKPPMVTTYGYPAGYVDEKSIADKIVGTSDGSNTAIQQISYRGQDQYGQWHKINAKVTHRFEYDSNHVSIEGSDVLDGGRRPQNFRAEAQVYDNGLYIQSLHMQGLDGGYSDPVNPNFPQGKDVPLQLGFMLNIAGAQSMEARAKLDMQHGGTFHVLATWGRHNGHAVGNILNGGRSKPATAAAPPQP